MRALYRCVRNSHTGEKRLLYAPLTEGSVQPLAWRRADKPKNMVGERVRQARLAHQPALHQADLAAALAEALDRPKFDRATVARIEAGDRVVSDVELVALATALDVSVGWLLFGEDA